MSELSNGPVVRNANATTPEKKITDNVHGEIIIKVAAVMTQIPTATAKGVNIQSYIPCGRRRAPTENHVLIEIRLVKFILSNRPKK